MALFLFRNQARRSSPRPSNETHIAILLLLCIAAGIYVGNAAHPGLLWTMLILARDRLPPAMLERGDWVILYMNGIRYLVISSFALLGGCVQLPFVWFERILDASASSAFDGRSCAPIYFFVRRYFGERAGLYSGLWPARAWGLLFTRIMIPEAIYALEFTALFHCSAWLDAHHLNPVSLTGVQRR